MKAQSNDFTHCAAHCTMISVKLLNTRFTFTTSINNKERRRQFLIAQSDWLIAYTPVI